MSEEILEKALKKTKELEEKAEKRMKVAKAIGVVAGTAIALTLDAGIAWLIVNFMIGVSVPFLSVLGVVILIQLLLTKVKSTLLGL